MILEKASEAMPYTVGVEWSVIYRSIRFLKWNLHAGQVEMLTMKALDEATTVQKCKYTGSVPTSPFSK